MVVTDKGRYIAGDTIWLRAFVADAASHKPVTESRYVYVELRNPFNGLASRVKLMCRDGRLQRPYPTGSGSNRRGVHDDSLHDVFRECRRGVLFQEKAAG